MASQRHDRKFWEGLIARYERARSKESAVSFAQRHSVDANTLKWWAWSLRRQAKRRVAADTRVKVKAPALLPVRVVASTAPVARWSGEESGTKIEIALPGGLRVQVAIGSDVEYVAALVKRLG